MALQGTLDTFSLDEVLALLEQTGKTGALFVTSPETSGVLYLADGALCGAEGSDGELVSPLTRPEELEARLLDLTFGLFRLRSGEFEFQTDRISPHPTSERIAVESVVAQVRAVLAEWDAVEAVITSVDARPRLVTDLSENQVTIDRAAWRVLFAVDGRRSVREIAAHLRCSVVGASRALKDLVNAGALELLDTSGASVVLDPEGAAAGVVDRALPEPDDGVELDDEALASLHVLASIEHEEPVAPELEADPLADLRAELADASAPLIGTLAGEVTGEVPGEAVVDEPDGEPGGEGAEAEGEERPARVGDGRNRGTLLRMFSSLRDDT